MSLVARLRERVIAGRRIEIGTILALGFVAGAAFLFLHLAGEIGEGETRGFDEAVLRAFRDPADLSRLIGPWWLEQAVADVTSLGSTTVLTLLTAAAVGYYVLAGERATALLVFVAVAGGTALSSALKLGYQRPRPELVTHLAEVHTASFPSGHAMLSAVVYLTLGAILARTERSLGLKRYWIALALVLTLLIGSSRILLGVHYPTDVIGGWAAGSAWAALVWFAALKLVRPTREARPDPLPEA